MKKIYAVLSLTLLFTVLSVQKSLAEANYVYHEATTNNPGCGPNFRSVLTPNSTQSLQIAWKLEFQFFTNEARVYYTTDGSNPAGAFGVGTGTTQVIAGTYNCTFGSPVVDVVVATIPAQRPGTVVKYIVSGWHSGGGAEIFGNGAGPGCGAGCGTITNNSSLATVFSYTVSNAGNVDVFSAGGSGSPMTSYSTLAAAVVAINDGATHTGAITAYVLNGIRQSVPDTGINLRATGTLANPIIIRKTISSGVNPNFVAYLTGTATAATTTSPLDGIFRIIGSDYVTIDGLNFSDSAANTTAATQMEFGIGFFKNSPTDGCQNNTITNCTITLNRNNVTIGGPESADGSCGIWVSNTLATGNAAVTLTSTSGANSENKFYTNTIQNCNTGIFLRGFAATSPTLNLALYDQNNNVGGSSTATGNIIRNYGGGTSAGVTAHGIRAIYQGGYNFSYNVINNNDGGGINHVSTVRSIFLSTSTSQSGNINNNTVTLQGGGTTSGVTAIEANSGSTTVANTINMNNNVVNVGYATATSGIFSGIVNASTAATVNINGNTVTGIATSTLAGTGTHVMIETGSPATANTNNNTITTLTRSGASGSWRGIKTTSPTNWNCTNNTVDGLSWTTVTSTGSIDGIYSLSSAVNVTITGNIVRNLSTPTTGTINGIRENGVSGTKTIQNNQVFNFRTTTGGAGGGTFNGIFCTVGNIEVSNNQIYSLNSTGTTGGTGGTVNGISISGGTTNNIFKNKIYDLSTNSTNPTVAGITISAGTTHTVTNNLIGDLRTPAANAGNALIGLNVTGGTTVNLNYNTVRLAGTSTGALFGSSAASISTSPTVTMRNNILINLSTPVGATGFASAYRRSGTTLTTYGSASNNNLFFAGTPGINNLLFYDGTNSEPMLSGYKTRVAPRDAQSVTENTTFASTTGSAATFLHIAAGTSTLAESGALNITGITDDFDAQVRQGNPGYAGAGIGPDIGADEFEGSNPSILPNDVGVLSLVTPSTTSTCFLGSEVVTVRVRNFGSSPQNFSTNNLTVTVNVTGAAIATLSATITSGTLAPGATLDVIVSPTLDMSADGTYTFNANTTYAPDGNATNDAMATVNIVKTTTLTRSPIASGNWSSASTWCGGVFPGPTNKVVIPAGITVTMDLAGAAIDSLGIAASGALNFTTGDLTVGPAASCGGNRNVNVLGTLGLSGGALNIYGKITLATGATFNMSSGNILLDPNDGVGFVPTGVSLGTGLHIFDITGVITSAVTGGTITIVDPPFSGTGKSLSYNASTTNIDWAGSTLTLGGTGGCRNTSTAINGFELDNYVGSGRLFLGNLIVNGGSTFGNGWANAAISTANGTYVTNLTINSGSEFRQTTATNFNVASNLVNNGTLVTAGTLSLTKLGTTTASTLDQSLSGSGIWANLVSVPTASFTNLLVNNTNTAGVTINVPLSVSGTLTLTAGFVNTTATNSLTLGISPTAVGTLARTSGFVKGPFKRYYAAATTAFGANASLLPVGGTSLSNGSITYYPAEVAFTTAPTTGGILTAEFISASAGNAGLPQSDGAYSATDIYSEGYWKIDNTGIVGGTYGVRITGSDFSSLQLWTANGEARLIKRASGAGTWGAFEGTHTNGSGYYVQRDGLTTFSEFAITKSNIVLPITLQYFKGVKTNAGNAVEWKVNCTSARITMEIERSADARNFNRITSVTADQLRCNAPFYFTDAQPLKATNYYRLKMIDMDGKVSYSAVIAIINADKGIEIVGMYPTMVNNSAFLSIAAAKAGKMQTMITDMSGKLIQSANQAIAEGSSLISVDCSTLSAGVYHITGYIDGSRTKTIRFIKL